VRCTLHQRAREKNDERAYARLNLFNVETCGVIVECLKIVKQFDIRTLHSLVYTHIHIYIYIYIYMYLYVCMYVCMYV